MTHSPTPSSIPSILQKIVATKKTEVIASKKDKSLDRIRNEAISLFQAGHSPRRGFANALHQKQASNQIGIIAEIKKASPSKGIISQNFNPSAIAKQYEQAGATCLSVLTDELYFKGHTDYLNEAKSACNLPVLRKDFMIDVYQIYESYLLGADCILLIVACLDNDTLKDLHRTACELGLDVLIEVHTQDELEVALSLPQSNHNIYGINNRDLNTFKTNLDTSINLKAFIQQQKTDGAKSQLLVTESGIHNADDLKLMLDHHINCFLIGEQFMKTTNPGDTLKTLLQSVATPE